MWKTVLFLIFSLVAVPLATYYTDSRPSEIQQGLLDTLCQIYLVAAAVCFIVSTLTKNYSQVDKLWSTIPLLYVWVVVYKLGFEPRVTLMAILVTVWGIRLTYNFARRGGYKLRFWEGEEDYRWAVLRAKPEFQPQWKWTLFNLFFISFYQMGLIMLFTFPIVYAAGGNTLNIVDGLLALLFIGLVVFEFAADQQQWKFQTKKYSLIKEEKELPEPYSVGFLRSGLWKYIRHPNYAAEQAIWICFYLFTISAGGSIINWSIAGCLLLVLLFHGSANFSEEISAFKYPEYKNYINRVGRFFPKFRRSESNQTDASKAYP